MCCRKASEPGFAAIDAADFSAVCPSLELNVSPNNLSPISPAPLAAAPAMASIARGFGMRNTPWKINKCFCS
jgi:hypothetical protein